MKILNYLSKKTSLLIILVAFLAASCGSYQQASYYDNDGIYNDTSFSLCKKGKRKKRSMLRKRDAVDYEGYFARKAREYDDLLNEDGTIFY